MTSGEELKYRNGLVGLGLVGWGISPNYQPWPIRASLLRQCPSRLWLPTRPELATLGELIEDGNDPRNILCAAVAMIRNMALEIGGTGLLAEAVEVLRGT